MSRVERRTMVIRAHPALSLSRQCRLLSIGRSSLYYTPKGESPETLALSRQCRLLSIGRSSLCYKPKGWNAETLALMRPVDKLFLKYPFYSVRIKRLTFE